MPIYIESTFSFSNMKKPTNALFIVVDTFRATSSMVALKNSGIEEILVVQEGSFAKKLKEEHLSEYLLIGEEGGLKIPGFDYGNTPSQFYNQDFSRKKAIFTSTSGAKTILLLKPYECVFIGSLVNLDRVSEEVSLIMNEDGSDLYILPAGYYKDKEAYTVEDWVTCLLIANKVVEKTNGFIDSQNNFLMKTKQLCEKEPNIPHLLKRSPNAVKLTNLGFEEDVNFALSINKINDFLKVKKWLNFKEINCVALG